MGAGTSAAIVAAVAEASESDLAETMKNLPAAERKKIAEALESFSQGQEIKDANDDSEAIDAARARAHAKFEEEWGSCALDWDLAMELADRCWAALANSDSVLDAAAMGSAGEALSRWGQGKFDLAGLEKLLQHSGRITVVQWRQYVFDAYSADSKPFFFALSELHRVLLAKKIQQLSSRRCIVHDIGADASTCLSAGHKLVHFVRHGQGNHNLHGDAKDNKTIDPPLNSTGQEQAAAANQLAQVHCPKLVVSSPMRRTMETAAIVWGHVARKAEFICHDGCREVDSSTVKSVMNRRRNWTQNAAERYGSVEGGVTFTFSPDLVASDTAMVNNADTDAELARRFHDFMSWLDARPEEHIAVVGHALTFEWIFQCSMDAGAGRPDLRDAMNAKWSNCEIRSVVLQFVDSPD